MCTARTACLDCKSSFLYIIAQFCNVRSSKRYSFDKTFSWNQPRINWTQCLLQNLPEGSLVGENDLENDQNWALYWYCPWMQQRSVFLFIQSFNLLAKNSVSKWLPPSQLLTPAVCCKLQQTLKIQKDFLTI